MSGPWTPGPKTISPYDAKWSSMPVPTGANGQPNMPAFNSVGDTQTGLLQQPYLTRNTLNTSGLEALRGQALRDPGTMSPWGQMAMSNAQNNNAQSMAGQQQQAQNSLAMSGGLRTGARERLAAQGMQNQQFGNQRAYGGIQMQDEQNRQQSLQNLPGQELGAANFDTGVQNQNINRSLGEINVGRGLQQNQYDQSMQAWAAQKAADAALAGNRKPGFNIFDPAGIGNMLNGGG